MSIDIRVISIVCLVTSLLLSVNPEQIGMFGTFVVSSIHFFALFLYGILAVGFTAVLSRSEQFTKAYIEQNKDKVEFDKNNIMESKAFNALSVIVALNALVIGIAIHSGWWFTTIIVTWAVLSTIAAFKIISKIKKKEEVE